MNILILVLHPNISESWVNRALGAAAEPLGGSTTVRYMYDLYPDFNIDVTIEQVTLPGVGRIVLQYPMYWLSCPPLLKKWLSGALIFGQVYGLTGTVLYGKELLLVVSVGDVGSTYGREGTHIYTIHELLQPMQGTSRVTGTKCATPLLSVDALKITDEAIARQMQDCAAALQTPELPLLDILGQGPSAALSYWVPVGVMTGGDPAYLWGAPQDFSMVEIVVYWSEQCQALLDLSLRAWTPVFPLMEQDVPAFVYRSLYPEGWRQRQSSNLAEVLDGEPDGVDAAVIDGCPVGWACTRLHPEDRMGEVYIVVVDPDYQRRGIGRAPMNHSTEQARATGTATVTVEIGGDLGYAPARATYEGLGFQHWPVARYFKDLVDGD